MHMSYFLNLVQVKKALMEQRYTRACNELGALIYYEPFFQGRIYYNVLRLLEESLPELGSGVRGLSVNAENLKEDRGETKV